MWKSLLFPIFRCKEKNKRELQHLIKHPHPLVFYEYSSSQREDHCSGCEGKVSGPIFCCVKCEFFLHKKCAEAPLKIDHPFHRDHPLILHPPSPHEGTIDCEICLKYGKGFYYRCSSCEIYLDINCALLPRDDAGNFIENFHFDHQQHSLLLIANDNNHLKYQSCYGCSSALTDASYACSDCRIFFHQNCVELPTKINHPLHRKHQLFLDSERKYLDCNLCKRSDWGYFYRCSPCEVDFHSICCEIQPIIEDKDHPEHPFILQLRPNSFTCDACGDPGNNVSYTCTKCNIQIHKKCIWLPCIIRMNLHHHLLYRNFFPSLPQDDSKTWECKICYSKVELEHASYYCSVRDCNFVVHVTCAKEDGHFYGLTELKNQDEVEKHSKELALLYNKSMDCITRVKEIKFGEDVIFEEIMHASHGHNLIFSNEKLDNKHCNGCVLPILSSFYYCSQCDFFLHKDCAELSSEKLLWFHTQVKEGFLRHTDIWFHHDHNYNPLAHITNDIFTCLICKYDSSGFSYKPNDYHSSKYNLAYCLRCATLPHSFVYQAHKPHYIFFDRNYAGQCSACGRSDGYFMWRSKEGEQNFALDVRCVNLPRTVWHKCDKHSLRLAYEDDNDYLLHHYCDICEERRDPKLWFYRCEVCDTAVHPRCVLGEYPFIKPGSYFTSRYHQHPLTFVQKIYDYRQCVECDEPCVDLSLECAENGCNYVVHWICIKPPPPPPPPPPPRHHHQNFEELGAKITEYFSAWF